MRFSRSSVALLSSVVSVSVSAQATYGKGKADITGGGLKSEPRYIPGRFIVEFAKTDDFRTAEDVSFFPPYIITSC